MFSFSLDVNENSIKHGKWSVIFISLITQDNSTLSQFVNDSGWDKNMRFI